MKELITVLLFCLSESTAQESLTARPDQLGVNTVLVIPSQAIDEYPVWSTDSQWIGAMVDGRWVKVELSRLELQAAKWHGSPIAAAKRPSLVPLPGAELKQWQQRATHGEREVKLPRGGSIQLRQHNLSTVLRVTDSKGKSRTVWATELENCGELSLSPDVHFVAYICELNGLIVSDVHSLLYSPAR